MHCSEKYFIAICLTSKHNIPSLTLDLEKAFDFVSFEILLKKLGYYGFDQNSICWVQDYFHDKEKCTLVDGSMSQSRKVNKRSAPRKYPWAIDVYYHSWMIYINQSTNVLFLCMRMITCMCFASKDPKILEKVINGDLKSATTWFSNNELLLNVDKCQVMLTVQSQIWVVSVMLIFVWITKNYLE